MPKKIIQKLREQLMERCREIFEMITHLESDLKTLEDRNESLMDLKEV